MASFVNEIRRRKIFQVAAVYAVVAWLAVQIVATVEAPLNLPDWVDTLVILLLAIGFPITIVISWAFNLTPDGLVRDEDGGAGDGAQVPPARTAGTAGNPGLRIEYVLIGLLVVAVAWLGYRVEFSGSGNGSPQGSQEVAASSTAVEAGSGAEGSNATGSEGAVPRAAEVIAESADSSGRMPNSVAVLPFENLSPNPDDAFFAAGIHEEVLNQLAKIHDLTVIARTSVLPYAGAGMSIPAIADELRVAAVMEGSVRYAGERVRVTAQLIDPVTGGHLWSEAYEDDIADVFGIQADIATQIAVALEAELLPEELSSIEQAPTESTIAYEWYLRERSLPSAVAFPAIIPAHLNLLDQAIANDPGFALPYAMKGNILAQSGSSDEAIELARQNAERALELDPDNSLALVAIGIIYRRQLLVAEERAAFERAYATSPSDPEVVIEYARFLSYAGEHGSAIEMVERAAVIDPNSNGVYTRGADVYYGAGEFEAMELALIRANELNSSFAVTHAYLAFLDGLMGKRDEGLTHLDTAERVWQNGAVWMLSAMVQAAVALDAPQTARLAALLEQRAPESEAPQPHLVFAALAGGNRDLARTRLLELIRLIDETDVPLDWSPIVDLRDNLSRNSILEEPEFVELRGRLGFRTR